MNVTPPSFGPFPMNLRHTNLKTDQVVNANRAKTKQGRIEPIQMN